MPAPSYVKLHYGVTDFAAGIQSVNQLRDNFQAIYEAWAVEHSTREVITQGGRGTGPAPNLALSYGRHNTPKVPRAVVKTSIFTSGFSVVLPGAITVQPVVTGIARLSDGLFFIGIKDLQEFYAEVEADHAVSTDQRVVIPRTSLGGNGAPVGITVECYEKNVGFDLTDFDFSAVIYGTVP